ncbi:hypothetical protein SNF32_03695 [Enterococcus mundtii]|nr:hypothetical protein [Enterococcus mundtii]
MNELKNPFYHRFMFSADFIPTKSSWCDLVDHLSCNHDHDGSITSSLYFIVFAGLFSLFLLLGGIIYLLGQNDLLPSIFAHTYDRLSIAFNPF